MWREKDIVIYLYIVSRRKGLLFLFLFFFTLWLLPKANLAFLLNHLLFCEGKLFLFLLEALCQKRKSAAVRVCRRNEQHKGILKMCNNSPKTTEMSPH